jgi:hypothetical protein
MPKARSLRESVAQAMLQILIARPFVRCFADRHAL